MLKANLKIKIADCISSGGYVGYSQVSPGTLGSIVAVFGWFALQYLFDLQLPGRVLGVIALIALSLITTHTVLKFSSSADQDPQHVVIDEWAGMWLTLLLTPSSDPFAILLAFVLFRFFDIIKPWPVSVGEKAPGAIGVLLDDLIAGLIALIVSILFFKVFRS